MTDSFSPTPDAPPAGLTLAESYAWCRSLSRRTARNFYYSFLTLSADRFRAMCVLYAFMRITDDLGDNDRPPADRAADLVAWRAHLTAACRGAAPATFAHPVLPALSDVVTRYQIPVEYLAAVITGVEMDLHPVAVESFGELSRYCYHVAGAVGLACIHLWGFHDGRALPAAVDCGTAFQLTNILRDVREDAALGRVYVPCEDLVRFGCTPAELAAGLPGERFVDLMQFEIARAREYYTRAHALFDYLDPPGQPILETMIGIYGGLLDAIECRPLDVLSRRVRLSRFRKLSLAARAIARHKYRTWFGRQQAGPGRPAGLCDQEIRENGNKL